MDGDSKRLLFLCTGNYYRSRFAEILFNHLAGEMGMAWRADSRGLQLQADNRGPISRHAVEGLKRLGISLGGQQRFPQTVTEDDLNRADRVIALKRDEHLAMIEEMFPAWVCRVLFWHVHDIDCASPVAALHELEREVVWLARRMAMESSRVPVI